MNRLTQIQKSTHDVVAICKEHNLCLKENSLKPLLYKCFLDNQIDIKDIAPERHGDFVIGRNVAQSPKSIHEDENAREFILEVKTLIFWDKCTYGEAFYNWENSINKMIERCTRKPCQGIFVLYVFYFEGEKECLDSAYGKVTQLKSVFENKALFITHEIEMPRPA